MIPRTVLVLALIAAYLVPTVRAITTAQYCMEPEEVAFVNLLNDYRVANGAPPVKADQVLGAAAEHHAIDMGQRNVLDHNLGDGTDFGTNISNHGWTNGGWLGEVAAGSYSSAYSTLIQFEHSPDHNAVLLDPKYVSVGVGRYDDGGKTVARWWWIGDFSSSAPMQAAVVCGVDVPSPPSPATVTPTRTATVRPATPSSTASATPPAPSVTTPPTRTATIAPTNTPRPLPTVTSTPTFGPTYTVPDDPTMTPVPTSTHKPKRCPTRNPHHSECTR